MSQLLKLLLDNRRQPTPIAQRLVTNEDSATVYLYDAIVRDKDTADWMGGVCPQDMVPLLASLKVSVIHLRINSPGGEVFAAQSIAQALREHPAKVVAHIDGIAASAATVISSACDEVVMAPGALFMVHQGSTVAWGNKKDMLDCSALLEKTDGTLVAQYVQRTGQSPEQINAWIEAETWFTAQEALEAGFIDRIAGDTEEGAPTARAAEWKLSAYKKPPAETLRTVVHTSAHPEPAATATPEHRVRQHQRLQLADRLTVR